MPGVRGQPTGLELGWDTRARYAFFSTYIGGFTRSMGEVTHHYRTATACDHLSASVEAASLAYMGTQLGSAHLMALANFSYVKVIQRLSRSLNDLSSDGAEEALQSVLLLDMYEKMVHRDPQNSQAWKSHSQGGLTLLHSRATTILSSPTGRQVAARLVTAVIVTCATVGINTPKELATFTLPGVCETNTLPFSPVQQLQCRTFLAPLYLVHQVSEDDSVKQWVKNCLAYMWQSGGLKTAKDITELMDTEPNLDYWSVFATTGSYAFAA
ncbi:C6 transcription factor [Colletotrichum asianum]